MPKAFFDYADRGSYTEDTLRANHDDLQQIKFRQRILIDVSKRDLSTNILGEPAAMPLSYLYRGYASNPYELEARRSVELTR